jgi:hypothetical protein
MLLYGGTVSFDIRWEHVSEPLADDDLSGLQQWTKDLFAAQGDDRAREFKLPVPSEAFLHRQSPLTSKKSRFQYIEKYELEHELRAITKGIANIILAASGNLRFCLECRRLFVASRKRVYCSDRCSQRVQDRKRPPDRKVKKRKKN